MYQVMERADKLFIACLEVMPLIVSKDRSREQKKGDEGMKVMSGRVNRQVPKKEVGPVSFMISEWADLWLVFLSSHPFLNPVLN